MKVKLKEHNSDVQLNYGGHGYADTKDHLTVGEIYYPRIKVFDWHTEYWLNDKPFNSVCFETITDCDCDIYKLDNCQILSLPNKIDTARASRTICVDACISNVIRDLLDHGIQTLGCCCGHGKRNPNVVISSNEEVDKVRKLLIKIDTRTWDILRWELVTYEC